MAGGDFSPAETPVLLIPVDQIDPGDRLRQLKQEQADAIGAAIKADGQYDPITVARLPGSTRFILVDGLHRLKGCEAHGITHIEARIGTANREARVRQEALSGVARANHDVFDKAAQVAALAALAREAAGKPAIGDLRKLNGRPLQDAMDEAAVDLVMMTKSIHWSEKAADQMGCSPKTARRYAQIAAAYSSSDIKLLREKDLAWHLVPLISLATLPPEQFARAMRFIAENDEPTIAAAMAPPAESKASPYQKKRDAFLGFLDSKCDQRQRAEIIREILSTYRENGQKRAESTAEGAE